MSQSSPHSAALTARIAQRRREFEATADALFDEAWGSMRELAQPFRYELDLCREPSGAWRDLFACLPYRAMDLPLVLLEDLGMPDGAAREALERALLDQSALGTSALLALELVLEAEAHVGYEHVLLHTALSTQATWRLAALAPDLGSTRTRSLAAGNDAADALLDHRNKRIGRSTPFAPRDLSRMGRRWAPLQAPMACALAHAGRMDLWPTLQPWLDEAACLFQLGRELGRITRDVSRGHYSAPIARLLEGIGATPPIDQPPDPDHTMLACLLPRAASELAAEALARTASLCEAVEALGLPAAAAWFAPLAEPFEALRDRHREGSDDAPPADGDPERVPFVVSAKPQLAQVLAAARGLMASDPSYRDAWEVNRWGFLNVPDLTCKVFPIGLVLDNRVAAGDDCAAEIDALFERYVHNRFHYFEQASALPPDCDTLGLMLGLAAHAAQPRRWRDALDEPLAWMRANIEADGGLPVFLTRGVDAGDGRAYAHVAGRHCAAVQARLLLGLVRHDAERFRSVVGAAARCLFEQVARARGGAFWFYDLPLGAGLVLQLSEALVRHGFDLEAEATTAVSTCVALLRKHADLARLSGQDAALLWLAGGATAAAEGLRHAAWPELLIRSQQQDGGWAAAPLYTLPTRGNLMTWYTSRVVTTSYAYRALRDFERWQRAQRQPR